MGNFIKEKWTEILVLMILIPFVGWSVTKLMETGERIARQENRTDQIIASLPDLRTRVAHQNVFGPFETALLVSKPYQVGTQWMTEIRLLDAADGNYTRFVSQMSDQNDTDKMWALYGRALAQDGQGVNFRDMQSMATTLQVAKTVPSSINPQFSLISNAPASEIAQIVKETGATIKNDGIAPDISDWPSLLDAIDKGPLQPQRQP